MLKMKTHFPRVKFHKKKNAFDIELLNNTSFETFDVKKYKNIIITCLLPPTMNRLGTSY